ncbi:MAG: hypothetical protein ACRBBT_07890 [Paracoccaceae bacterium]
MRGFLLTAALVVGTAGAAGANQYAARYTPALLNMQGTCVDFVLRKVNDGSKLAKSGLAVTRKSKKKTVYKGKAGLGGALDTVYSVVLGENKKGVRGCTASVIRTNYKTGRIVYNAALNDLRKRGGKLVGAPSGGNYSYTHFQFGQTVIQVKASFSSNSLVMNYYIPRN